MSNTNDIRLLSLLILTLLLLIGCAGKNPFSYDFEDVKALDTLSWRCKTVFSLSDMHVTSGQKCLKMVLYPYPYSGIILNKFNPDWSENTILKFDIYNPGKISLRLTTCIHDANDPLRIIYMDNLNNPIYNNGYTNSIVLDPGTNHITLSLDSFSASETMKRIDFTNIQTTALFFPSLKEKRTIYLDNLRLE